MTLILGTGQAPAFGGGHGRRPAPTLPGTGREGSITTSDDHRPGQSRDLAGEGRVSDRWRVSGGGAAPRLGAREYIGDGLAGRGLLADRDPLITGRLPTRWEWTALAAWTVLAGVRAWQLWRRIRPFSGR